MLGMIIWCVCIITINVAIICAQVYLVKQKNKYRYILPSITFLFSIIHMFTNGVGENNKMPVFIYFIGINVITFVLLGISFIKKGNCSEPMS